MKKEIVQKLHTSFEDVAHEQDGVAFWLARDLQVLLGYDEWRNFTKVIGRAQEACRNSGQSPIDHFVDVNKMVELGSSAKRKVNDFMLTRYACYLIAQNGDPSKEPIAFAQTYFAVQTRKQLMQRLSKDLLLRHGKGFSISHLYAMRRFYEAYPILQSLIVKLSWAHHVELLTITDPLARSFYEKQCADENWSVRQLKRQVQLILFSLK